MEKLKYFTVDRTLAEQANAELHTIKVSWQYTPITARYYTITKIEQHKIDIDEIDAKYGPVKDTQKFTHEIYRAKDDTDPPFTTIRFDPNSRYNRLLPNTSKLVNAIQTAAGLDDHYICRLFVNMQTIVPKWSMNAIHPDFLRDGYKTILYYVNDSDGDTFVFEGSEPIAQVKPTMGNGIVFPSCLLHAGSSPLHHDTRVVINIVLKPK